mmetsp:Transcript_7225/g.15841  ORF Transcript_7225/g.15841 Transcript_7225/m.15841 type:complete len:84 (+) Transcript_7225:32-283(+)
MELLNLLFPVALQIFPRVGNSMLLFNTIPKRIVCETPAELSVCLSRHYFFNVFTGEMNKNELAPCTAFRPCINYIHNNNKSTS